MNFDNSSYKQFESNQGEDAQDDGPKTTLVSKNITILGRRTSVRLEPEMWNALRDISARENCSIHDICSLIHIRKNPVTSLTAAIRVFMMLYYRAAATTDGHQKAGHGNFENMKRRARLNVDMKSLRNSGSGSNRGMSDTTQSEYNWLY